MLRALQRFLGTRRPRARRQLRPRRLPRPRSRRTSSRRGLARVFAGDYTVLELPTLDVADRTAAAGRPSTTSSCTSSSLGRMVRARVGGRRRGPRHAGLRRRHLRDAVGIDRVQPLERRPRARLGPRRDGGDLRRSAFAPRAPARRPARRDVVTIATETPDVAVDAARRRPRASARSSRAASVAIRLGDADAACSRRFRRSTFFRRYRDTFGSSAERDTLSSALLRRLRIENLVLIRDAELEFAPGLNAITGETGAGKTILAQAIGLLLGARGDAARSAPARRRGVRRGRARLPRASGEGSRALAELRPDGRGGARGRAAHLRRRADARLRLGPRGCARGRRRRRRSALIAMSGPVPAAAARTAGVPARRARRVLRRRASVRAEAARGLARAARRRGAATTSSTRDADAARAARGAARARRGHRRARARHGGGTARRARAAAASRGARRRHRGRRSRRSRPTRARAPPALRRARSARVAPLERSRPSSRAPATSCATSSSGCARPRRAALVPRERSRPSPAGWSRSRPSSSASPTRGAASAARPTRSCSRAPPRRGVELDALDAGVDPAAGGRGGARRGRDARREHRTTQLRAAAMRRAPRASPRRSRRARAASASARASSRRRAQRARRSGRRAPTRSRS